ncbi:MarC family protein, partial [Enterobacter hormaechei]
RRRWVALREVVLAFVALLVFMLAGDAFLRVMHLSERSLEVAGGVILLMISIRMIFSSGESIYAAEGGREPFIFPLAIPLMAGPSAMATVLLLAARQPERLVE